MNPAGAVAGRGDAPNHGPGIGGASMGQSDKRARYRRILVKLSGEALLGAEDYGIDPVMLKRIANEVRDVTARLCSGTVQGKADVDLTDLASPAFRIESSAAHVQANDLVSSLTPAKNLLSGTMDMTSVISGKGSVPDAIVRTLAGEGNVNATGGKIALTPAVAALWSTLGLPERQAIEFKELASAFQLDGGRIVTKDLAVRGGDATWKARGAVAFDGALDYDIEVELAEETANAVRKKIGFMIWRNIPLALRRLFAM